VLGNAVTPTLAEPKLPHTEDAQSCNHTLAIAAEARQPGCKVMQGDLIWMQGDLI